MVDRISLSGTGLLCAAAIRRVLMDEKRPEIKRKKKKSQIVKSYCTELMDDILNKTLPLGQIGEKSSQIF